MANNPINCCTQKPIIEIHSGEKLCKPHFIDYFEAKVLKTIRRFDLIGDKENLGVALSGGKDSLTLLNILKKLSNQNPNIKITAIAIDEGIKGYREHTLKTAFDFCNKNNIDLKIFSYRENFGYNLDEILKLLDVRPCTICGIFRRYMLNKKSRELGLTKIATGHNLDDECQSILMNQFGNNIKESARLGPMTGVASHQKFIPRIKPLYLCTEKEVATYAYIRGLLSEFSECPNAAISFRAKVRDMLNELENKSPGTKYSVVNSFLKILPDLKKGFGGDNAIISSCTLCGEPCSKSICKACFYIKKLAL